MILWNVTRDYEWTVLLQRNINFRYVSNIYNHSFLVNCMMTLWPYGRYIANAYRLPSAPGHNARVIRFEPQTLEWAEYGADLVSSKVLIVIRPTNTLIRIDRDENLQFAYLELKESVNDIL